MKLLEQARAYLGKEQFTEAERLLRDIAARSDLKSPRVAAALAEAAQGMGRLDEAAAIYREAVGKFPADAQLNARLGVFLIQQGRVEEALRHFERMEPHLRRDPALLRNHGYALMVAGRMEEAERLLSSAVALGGGPEARLTLALAWARNGRCREAEEACARLELVETPEGLADAARSLRAECLLLLADPTGALAIWKGLRGRKKLQLDQLGHMAYAAQLAGDTSLCDELIGERLASEPQGEDLLLFAQIANVRGDPLLALERLEAATRAPGERNPGYAFLVEATRGRALRLMGRKEEARRVLENAARRPEAASARLGAKVHVDLGHLAAEDGDFDSAAGHFRRALELDPGEPEAARGLELTGRRVAWRTEQAASGEARLEAAQAEVEAMRRRFLSREGELEALRRELEKMKAAQREAEVRARKAEEEARRRAAAAQAEHHQRVREELQEREAEIAEKARLNVELALGDAAAGRCPPALRSALLVAETTFQKALYTELPAAAVAVLFAGALERALYLLFVERFRLWLKEKGLLAGFLKGAVRERRGTRVEYFDHFVEAFDEERPGRAPSMGEVGRVLGRRKESYLGPFRQFLEAHHPRPDAFYDELVAFILWAKEKLRDPVAHGRGIEMGYEELRRFRERLLFSFGYGAGGVLAQLLA